MRVRRPVRSEIHPLEAYGLKLQLTGGTKQLGGETEFLRPEIHGFVTFPVVSRITFFAQARGVYQTGTSLAQDFVGFSRYDNLQFELPANANVVTLTTADRVRGHRQFLLGNKTAFASAEVRLPLLKTTGTKILGIFEIGEVTLSGFADAGYVDGLINIPGETSRKMTGYGYEFKNAFLIGPVQISHAVGVGYAGGDFTSEKADWHYRIRAALPF
jgi:outer membrane protein assembly factor BamA